MPNISLPSETLYLIPEPAFYTPLRANLCPFHVGVFPGGEGGGALSYMGYIGMYRSEGYGFQAVYSRIGYINQSIWV